MRTKVDLASFDNSWYKVGASRLKQLLWYYTNLVFFKSAFFPVNGMKLFLLRLYGAKIGKGCIIKPSINIKYPWKLKLGDHCWIGENVWIDNLAEVTIGNHVCISQGAFILCGNHNYKLATFDLMISPISIDDGAWVGAKSIVCPGAVVEENVVLSVATVLQGKTEKNMIYSGNPSIAVKERIIE